MAFSRLKSSCILRYFLWALFFGLAATVCAESARSKDVGQLTLDEIEDSLQVSMHYDLNARFDIC